MDNLKYSVHTESAGGIWSTVYFGCVWLVYQIHVFCFI